MEVNGIVTPTIKSNPWRNLKSLTQKKGSKDKNSPTNTGSHISNLFVTTFEPVDLAILSNHKFLHEL